MSYLVTIHKSVAQMMMPLDEKSEDMIGIHLLGTRNVCTTFHGIPSNMAGKNGGPTDNAIHGALSEINTLSPSSSNKHCSWVRNGNIFQIPVFNTEHYK